MQVQGMVNWVVRTLILCFVVGVVLSVFEIDPARILTDSWRTIQQVGDLLFGIVRWALPYILIGAVIVVPLSVIGAVLRWSRSRPRPDGKTPL